MKLTNWAKKQGVTYKTAWNHFKCQFCEHKENADVNASKVIAKRFGDNELNGITDYRKVKPILLNRFFNRFPVARSASGGLELSLKLREIGR